MTDVETRLRATLHAVADATVAATAEPMAPYVEQRGTPARGRRSGVLVAAAAAAVLVVGALALAQGDDPQPLPLATQPTPAASGAAAPEGGRLIAEGTVDGRRWTLYGADHLPEHSDAPGGTSESPCWLLAVEGVEPTSSGCGADPHSATGYRQMGPVPSSGDAVLFVGVLSPDVTKVVVQVASDPATEPALHADPAHPAGAKYFVASAPRGPQQLTVRLLAGDRELTVVDYGLDGPVGG